MTRYVAVEVAVVRIAAAFEPTSASTANAGDRSPEGAQCGGSAA